MSERISVDHAFDPELRKAQADFDAYMDTRPYKDAKGSVHNPETGEFANYDKLHDKNREDHYNTTLAEGDYSGESLQHLAERVSAARAEGDKTRAADAEQAFFDKFELLSDKYGWEEEVIDESATDQMHVDDNAKIGRSTIDDRLERYARIMYDTSNQEAATNTKDADTATNESQDDAESSAQEADTNTSTKEEKNSDAVEPKDDEADVPTGDAIWRNGDSDQPVKVTGYAGTDSDGRKYVNIEGSKTAIPMDEVEMSEFVDTVAAESDTSKTEEEPEVVAEAAAVSADSEEKKPFDLKAELDKMEADLNKVANDKFQALEDRISKDELDKPIKGAEDDSEEAASQVSKDELDAPINGAETNETVESNEPTYVPGLFDRIGARLISLRHGFSERRHQRRAALESTMTPDELEDYDRKRRFLVGLGVVTAGVVAYELLTKIGIHIAPKADAATHFQNGGAHFNDVPAIGGHGSEVAGSAQLDAGSSSDAIQRSHDAILNNSDWNIPKGSGGEAMMNRLGVDKSVWYENQNEFLKKFPGAAYRMSDGNIGLNLSGKPSDAVIKFWAQKADLWK